MDTENNDIAEPTGEPLVSEQVSPGGEPDATAAPEPGDTPPEEGPTEAAPKTFSQEELDAIVAKRLAREQRKWEREQSAKAPAPAPDDETPLTREQIIAQYEAGRQQEAIAAQWDEREEAALEEYDDFQQVAYNPTLPVSESMKLALETSEIGPKILYWLGSNPKEAARIARLHPVQQVREIGKVEAQIAANPPARKTTGAPAPINPVTPRSNGTVTDTTDPRSIGSMSTSEWIAAERARQMKKLAAR